MCTSSSGHISTSTLSLQKSLKALLNQWTQFKSQIGLSDFGGSCFSFLSLWINPGRYLNGSWSWDTLSSNQCWLLYWKYRLQLTVTILSVTYSPQKDQIHFFAYWESLSYPKEWKSWQTQKEDEGNFNTCCWYQYWHKNSLKKFWNHRDRCGRGSPSCWKQRQVFPKRNGRRARTEQFLVQKSAAQCRGEGAPWPWHRSRLRARPPHRLLHHRQSAALQRFSCSRAAAAAQRLAPRRRRSARATCSKLSREPPGFPSGVRTHQNRCCSRARLCAAAEQSAEPGGCTSGWSSSSRAALLLLLLSNPCHNHDSRLPCHSPQKRQSATKWVDKRFSCTAPLMENFFSKIAAILSQLDIC